ncbi:MAG: twin-arginine translocase subunit TatC [Phycisphaerales bacterium]|nr:twin-arginine translocase subunit TatC [Phycisphaerales bacterium]
MERAPANRSSGRDPGGSVMPLGDHLEELRARIIIAILGLLPVFAVSLLLSRTALRLIIAPMQEALLSQGLPGQLQTLSPVEPLTTWLRVGLVLTVIFGAPWLVYQLWRFISPGLYRNERRFVHVLIPMSFFMSLAGVLFLYKLILPLVLVFFLQFGAGLGRITAETMVLPDGTELPSVMVLPADPIAPEAGSWWMNTELMQLRIAIGEGERARVVGVPVTSGNALAQQPRLSEYTRLILNMALAFALGFQTPVVVLLLGWMGLVTPASLGRVRRYAVLGAAVVGSVLTPADPISMVMLAVPLYLLYELGILLLRVMPMGKEPDTEAPDEAWYDDPHADSGKGGGKGSGR